VTGRKENDKFCIIMGEALFYWSIIARKVIVITTNTN